MEHRLIKNDFEFIIDLMKEFISKKYIQDRLNIIEKEQITGWEIWWQIEFSAFLSTHHNISFWDREFLLPVDKRTKWKKETMSIDFIIKKKYSKKDEYIALELKQHKSMKQCITKMCIDIEKTASIKRSYDILRTIWNIGIFYKDKESKINNNLEYLNGGFYKNCIEYQEIKNTNFAFIIF